MHWLRAIRAPGRSAAPAAPSTSIEGRRVGPYQLLSELGRGGMGSVWLARRDDGQYEGQVAIKLLAASWLGHEGEQRFRQEGTLLARLDHPNIARLLDAGVTELDQPYLVLEYVQGERVDEHCRRSSCSSSC
jgi:eukaryotic-like serine/threonine-protein kinase